MRIDEGGVGGVSICIILLYRMYQLVSGKFDTSQDKAMYHDTNPNMYHGVSDVGSDTCEIHAIQLYHDTCWVFLECIIVCEIR